MKDKVLFRVKCLNGFQGYYIVGKIYKFYENKGLKAEDGNFKFSQCKTFKDFTIFSQAEWELVEETLLDKFYDLLEVENLEKFYLSDVSNDKIFMFDMGELKATSNGEYWNKSEMIYNILRGHSKIIKLPPKPQFTEIQKEDLKALYTLYGDCYIARDSGNRGSVIYIYDNEPKKYKYDWQGSGKSLMLKLLTHKFRHIKWEDTESFKVDKQLIDSFKENDD